MRIVLELSRVTHRMKTLTIDIVIAAENLVQGYTKSLPVNFKKVVGVVAANK